MIVKAYTDVFKIMGVNFTEGYLTGKRGLGLKYRVAKKAYENLTSTSN